MHALTASPQAHRLLRRRRSALVRVLIGGRALSNRPTPTLTGGHSLAAVAASVHGSTSGVTGRAGAAAAAVAGLSIARRGGPSEVRFGMHMPARACTVRSGGLVCSSVYGFRVVVASVLLYVRAALYYNCTSRAEFIYL